MNSEPKRERPDTYLGENFAHSSPKQPVRKPRKRGTGISIRTLLLATVVLAFALAILRLFQNNLEALVGLSFLMLISLGIGMAFVLARRRAALQEAFLTLVAASRKSGLPIHEGLLAFAAQCGHKGYRRRIMRMADEMKAGSSLPDAVTISRSVLPRELIAPFRALESVGGSATAMTRMAVLRNGRIEAFNPLLNMVLYFLIVTFQFSLIATFLFYFIWPKFQAILGDFNAAPPALGQAISVFLQSSWTLDGELWWMIALAIPFLIVYLLVLSRSGRGMGFFGRFVPWITTGERATVMRGLAETIRTQKPIDGTLHEFAEWSLRRIVRRRCRLARQAMISGVDWVDALVGERLVRPCEAPLLKAAAAAGQPATALERLADTIQARQWYRWRLFTETAHPLLTVAFSLLVFLLCLGFFQPLVMIIRGLA